MYRNRAMSGAEDAATFDSMASTSIDSTGSVPAGELNVTSPTFAPDPSLLNPAITLYQPGLPWGATGPYVGPGTGNTAPTPNTPQVPTSSTTWIIAGAFALLIVLLATKR